MVKVCSILLVLISLQSRGQSPGTKLENEQILNLIEKDSYLKHQQNFVLYYVFSHTRSGFVIIKNAAHFKVYHLENTLHRIIKCPVPDSLTKNLIRMIRKRDISDISLNAFHCGKRSSGSDFKMFIMVKKSGKIIGRSSAYSSCINDSRNHPQYNFYISFFVLMNDILGLHQSISLHKRRYDYGPTE